MRLKLGRETLQRGPVPVTGALGGFPSSARPFPPQGPSLQAGRECHSDNSSSGLTPLSQYLAVEILATEQLSGFLCCPLLFFLIEGF